MRSKIEAIKEMINQEKSKLNDLEKVLLQEIRERITETDILKFCVTDNKYNVLSEDEKIANNSKNRINYILTKEIEYYIVNKLVPQRIYDWIIKNKTKLISSASVPSLLAIFAYYLENKEQIDVIVSKIISGMAGYTSLQDNNVLTLNESTVEEIMGCENPIKDNLFVIASNSFKIE